MAKHPVFCSILKQISDEPQYPGDPFAALADFKVILEKALKRTVHELLRKTPGRLGAKLLSASTALRAYRNRLPWFADALLQSVGTSRKMLIDFHGLSQIIASLTRERLAERGRNR